jgi:hypothetical protein
MLHIIKRRRDSIFFADITIHRIYIRKKSRLQSNKSCSMENVYIVLKYFGGMIETVKPLEIWMCIFHVL